MNDPREAAAPPAADEADAPEETYPVANRADRRAWRHARKVHGRRKAREADRRTAARNR